MTITEQMADGLDASIDGRGLTAEHVRAIHLANAAPDFLDTWQPIAALPDFRPHSDTGNRINLKAAVAWAKAAIAKATSQNGTP